MILKMNQMNYKKLDLNLLIVLNCLLEQRSVTKAARVLGLSQPAVSHALSRLRDHLNDPLFVSAGTRFEPTARALDVGRTVAPFLSAVEASIREGGRFDPAETTAVFRVGMSEDLQASLLPRLARLVQRQAPHARLVVISTDYRRARETMANNEITSAIGYLDGLAAHTKVQKLGRVGYSVISTQKRRAKKLRMNDYCEAQHALVTSAGDLTGYIDDTLSKLGRSRTIRLSLSSFTALPFALKGTDLMATIPDHLAQELVRVAGLHTSELPFETPRYDISLAWRAEANTDPAEIWFRDAIRQSFREFVK